MLDSESWNGFPWALMALPKAELDDQKIDFVEMDHPLTALGWGP